MLGSKTATTNFLQSINCIYLIIGSNSLILYKLQIPFFLETLYFTLLIKEKSILRIILILASATKKVFWKNWASFGLFSIQKLIRNILNLWKVELSVFWILTLVVQIFKPSLKVYARVMSFILLLELINNCFFAWFLQNHIK